MRASAHSEQLRGLVFAVASSAAFALSGPLVRVLVDVGWTPHAVATIRTAGAFAVLLIPGLAVLSGRWCLLRGQARRVVGFGGFAVAGSQLCFFNAVARMPVAVALLIEYMAPVLILVWLWLRHDQRPTRLTVLGAACGVAGLTVVLGVLEGVTVSTAGLLWAIGAMVGTAGYFLLAADDRSELPPIVLATAGLGVGALALAAVGVLGVQPFLVAAGDVRLAGAAVPWWWAAGLLVFVTGALAYLVGVVAARLLGARLMSFAALTEVLFAALFAWLLLGEGLDAARLAGGLLVVAGIAMVRVGESVRAVGEPPGLPEMP